MPAWRWNLDNANSAGGTVLVGNDEETVRGTTKLALVEFGYQVEVAKNGLRGVERFTK